MAGIKKLYSFQDIGQEGVVRVRQRSCHQCTIYKEGNFLNSEEQQQQQQFNVQIKFDVARKHSEPSFVYQILHLGLPGEDL